VRGRRGGGGAGLGGFGYLAVTAFAGGLNWPVMKLLMRDWPPFAFRIIAAAGALTLLAAVARGQGDSLRPPRGQGRRLVLASLLNVTPWSLLAPLSLFWLDAAEAAIIAYAWPVFATLLAWPFLGERPTARRVAGLALGLSGVVLLMAGSLAGAPFGDLVGKLPGLAAMLGCGLMFAAGTVFTKRHPVAMPAVPLVGWQLAIGLVPVAVVAAVFEWPLDLGRVTWVGWACLAYVAVVAQVLAYLVWFRALRRLPASTAAIGSLMVPVVGVIGSGLLLGEALGLRQRWRWR
jgi:drug/metabolite transporter (DMT)-like permease